MELIAGGTPFVSFPLKWHFEQRIHVAHRLARHGHARALEVEDATPDGVAEAIAGALAAPVDYGRSSRAGQLERPPASPSCSDPRTLAAMPYSTAEARQQLLDDLAHAVDEIGVALGALGDAYELVDERSGDQLEEELFRPVGLDLRRAQRTPQRLRRAHRAAAAALRARGRRAAVADGARPARHGARGARRGRPTS